MVERIKDTVDIIVKAADDKLGQDIKVLDIDQRAGICDYFVIVTGRNINHTQAIADQIEEKMKDEGFTTKTVEGYREGQWILLDFGDTIVHIFTADQREFYNLEGLWK